MIVPRVRKVETLGAGSVCDEPSLDRWLARAPRAHGLGEIFHRPDRRVSGSIGGQLLGTAVQARQVSPGRAGPPGRRGELVAVDGGRGGGHPEVPAHFARLSVGQTPSGTAHFRPMTRTADKEQAQKLRQNSLSLSPVPGGPDSTRSGAPRERGLAHWATPVGDAPSGRLQPVRAVARPAVLALRETRSTVGGSQ